MDNHCMNLEQCSEPEMQRHIARAIGVGIHNVSQSMIQGVQMHLQLNENSENQRPSVDERIREAVAQYQTAFCLGEALANSEQFS